MPGRFLSELERERLSQFPPEVSAEDLITYFTLSARDLAFLEDRRGDPNRLGLALQVGTLRYLGFCPDDLTTAPETVVTNLADQLKVKPTALADYGRRSQTRTEHLQEVMAYLGFRLAEPGDLDSLRSWLVERALEHDRPTLLFQMATEKLYTAQIVRPGVTILERLVMSARDQAQQETFHRLEPLLTPQCCTVLDNLLIFQPPPDQTPLNWLRQEATTNSPRAILSAIEKLTFLRQQGVDTWDLNQLSPNRLKQLAQLAKKSTSQALRRAPKERRYPILLAFLAQRLIETTDEVVDLYIRCLAETDARPGGIWMSFGRRWPGPPMRPCICSRPWAGFSLIRRLLMSRCGPSFIKPFPESGCKQRSRNASGLSARWMTTTSTF